MGKINATSTIAIILSRARLMFDKLQQLHLEQTVDNVQQ
jgi:hypothetical protein